VQHTTTHCNTLLHNIHIYVVYPTPGSIRYLLKTHPPKEYSIFTYHTATHCNTYTLHCDTLQHIHIDYTATHCNTIHPVLITLYCVKTYHHVFFFLNILRYASPLASKQGRGRGGGRGGQTRWDTNWHKTTKFCPQCWASSIAIDDVVQCVAVCCSVWLCVAAALSLWMMMTCQTWLIRTCCSLLQCVAVYCRVLQQHYHCEWWWHVRHDSFARLAVCRSAWGLPPQQDIENYYRCNTLRHTSTHCKALPITMLLDSRDLMCPFLK